MILLAKSQRRRESLILCGRSRRKNVGFVTSPAVSLLVTLRAREPSRGEWKNSPSVTARFPLASCGREHVARPPNHPVSPNVILLANSGSRCRLGHKGLESGWSGLGRTVTGQPQTHPDKGDRRGGQDMLETGFRCASRAGTSHPKRPHGLGDGPFNASALGVLGCLGRRPFPLPCGLQAQMLCLWSHGDGPPCGTGRIGSAGARLALTLGEFNLDHRVVTAIDG